MKTIILIWYLRITALVQIGLWGLSHLFYPEWYMTVIAGKDPALLTTFNMLAANSPAFKPGMKRDSNNNFLQIISNPRSSERGN